MNKNIRNLLLAVLFLAVIVGIIVHLFLDNYSQRRNYVIEHPYEFVDFVTYSPVELQIQEAMLSFRAGEEFFDIDQMVERMRFYYTIPEFSLYVSQKKVETPIDESTCRNTAADMLCKELTSPEGRPYLELRKREYPEVIHGLELQRGNTNIIIGTHFEANFSHSWEDVVKRVVDTLEPYDFTDAPHEFSPHSHLVP